MTKDATNHKRFEELCALAALGEIPPQDFADLSVHLRQCPQCRAAYTGFSRVLHAQFVAAEIDRPTKEQRPRLAGGSRGLKKRFLARANQLGFRFSPESKPGLSWWGRFARAPWLSYRYASALLLAVLLVMFGMLGHRWRRAQAHSAAERATLSRENARLRQENTDLHRQAALLRQRTDTLTQELSVAEGGNSALERRRSRLEAELEKATQELRSLEAERAAAQAVSIARRDRLEQAEETLSAVRTELGSLRHLRSQEASLIARQQQQLDALSQQLRQQAELLERERRLMVADRDIRALMGARNLHIYDVIDVDSKGENKRSFGRVFYTEGTSLIFYAFDLESPSPAKAKHSFQAWGQPKYDSRSAVSLGVFYVDNAEQRRWVLKFDDPEVLSQINAVFVTVEPYGGGEHPTGQKLLYAFLSNKPNHP